MTFSKRLGFLETGSDVGGIIANLESRLNYFAWVRVARLKTLLTHSAYELQCGQIPILDKFLVKSPIALRAMSTNYAVKFTLGLVKDRMRHPSERVDFLDMFLRAKQEHPEVVDDRQVTSYSVTNVFAGSDTTAISLRSVIYHLLKNPEKLRKTVEEIDGVVQGRDCWQRPVTFAEANTMTYLQAVLKEAMRVHPAVGLLLERTVPREGCEIAGTWLPGGTTVGIDPWVLHRNTEVYGKDASNFRPERWLEADAETLKSMDRCSLVVRTASSSNVDCYA